MRKPILFALAVAAAVPAPAAAPKAPPADIAASVAASDRPEDARKLDESRRPAEILAFMGLRRGDIALDLFTGTGYWAEIMARAVGPRGGVLAWEPANFYDAKTKQGWAELKARAPNAGLMVSPADSFSLPRSAFDFVMLNLNYHDTYWQSAKFNFPRVDPAAFLATLHASVKPGGIVAVIDHVADPGGDTREVVEKLHRIDPAVAKADFERAGFVLEAESNLLRNRADDHKKLVFDPAVRGKTDRIAYRFRKPAR
ncbi:MAG TPA: methyltransferase [Allosphingosinicella sp.]|jgi:predicted methyltransferase|nr:methyltransferase [Allosphingosinicella sp.]